jgi:hypothetical protein
MWRIGAKIKKRPDADDPIRQEAEFIKENPDGEFPLGHPIKPAPAKPPAPLGPLSTVPIIFKLLQSPLGVSSYTAPIIAGPPSTPMPVPTEVNPYIYQDNSAYIPSTHSNIESPSTPPNSSIEKIKESEDAVHGGEDKIVWGDVLKLTPFISSVSTKLVPIWIGYCPLFYVDNLNFGESDRTLKYRSSGGLFLAHQKGEYDGLAIRIHFYLYGPQKHTKLQALSDLRDLTSARLTSLDNKMMSELNTEFNKSFESYKDKYNDARKGWLKACEEIKKKKKDILAKIVFKNFEKRSTENHSGKWVDTAQYYRHKPIPFVSPDIVLRSVYLESMVIDHDAKHPDLIEGELMVRRYLTEDEIDTIKLGPGLGLQETNKIDITNRYLNYILRTGSAIIDCAYDSFNTMSPYNILEVFTIPRSISSMILKRTSIVPNGLLNIFSFNPGDINIYEYEWDEVNYNRSRFPIIEMLLGIVNTSNILYGLIVLNES